MDEVLFEFGGSNVCLLYRFGVVEALCFDCLRPLREGLNVAFGVMSQRDLKVHEEGTYVDIRRSGQSDEAIGDDEFSV